MYVKLKGLYRRVVNVVMERMDRNKTGVVGRKGVLEWGCEWNRREKNACSLWLGTAHYHGCKNKLDEAARMGRK